MKLIILALCSIAATAALAQDAPSAAPPAVPTAGWVDGDGDGRHDLYRDADGDGVNDVSGLPYAHRFKWADADGDAANDLWRDADGDGVNDLEASFRDRDGDGRDDNVLDLDADGRNDVTGRAYGRGDLHGDEFGFVVEGEAWIDEDGDGFADGAAAGARRGRQDRFIDNDGDGMADDCWFEDGGFRHHRARTGQGGGAGGPGGSGGSGGGNQWRGGGSQVYWRAL